MWRFPDEAVAAITGLAADLFQSGLNEEICLETWNLLCWSTSLLRVQPTGRHFKSLLCFFFCYSFLSLILREHFVLISSYPWKQTITLVHMLVWFQWEHLFALPLKPLWTELNFNDWRGVWTHKQMLGRRWWRMKRWQIHRRAYVCRMQDGWIMRWKC